MPNRPHVKVWIRGVISGRLRAAKTPSEIHPTSVFSVSEEIWSLCLVRLEEELSSQQLNTWIRPLQSQCEADELRLLAPNRFVRDCVEEKFGAQIKSLVSELSSKTEPLQVVFAIGERSRPSESTESSRTRSPTQPPSGAARTSQRTTSRQERTATDAAALPIPISNSNLNRHFTFETFVVGKSNQLGQAAARQVLENPGKVYNPFFIYGCTGLGKTHLMQAIGNALLQRRPEARVLYLHSERFVSGMVKALQHNTINDFKRLYRSVDALLIDDIQFFANKERSQEEFFHTFNVLLEGQQQVILTCDRFPKEVEGLEERLKSRFGWGLTVAVEPPELETRVAILHQKAEQQRIHLPAAVAFFIAERVRSNVRELEGALRRVAATAELTGSTITLDFVKEALRDLFAVQAKQVSIENIQKTVAAYYKIRVTDLLSQRRTRNITRPRQLAMALAKELTGRSLAELGDAFGGRDHTTILHGCRTVAKLQRDDQQLAEDYANLLRILST